jgi:RNA polymerase sigma factor (TIGR02999 family)
LVHETYLRLVGNRSLEWDSRGHFFAAAAEAMRRILIERARAKAALKRGGDCEVLSLTEWDGWIGGEEPRSEHLLALDDALVKLERLDPGMAQVVKLRYFAGLSVVETASTLQLAPRTVGRHWVAARAWLLRELREVGPAGTEHGPA